MIIVILINRHHTQSLIILESHIIQRITAKEKEDTTMLSQIHTTRSADVADVAEEEAASTLVVEEVADVDALMGDQADGIQEADAAVAEDTQRNRTILKSIIIKMIIIINKKNIIISNPRLKRKRKKTIIAFVLTPITLTTKCIRVTKGASM